MSVDPRVNAYRSDLADLALADTVEADRFVEPLLRQCIRGVLPVFDKPDFRAQQISQVRYGEFLDVFEMRNDGFAWVQNRTDRYVGYLPGTEHLSEEISALSKRISALSTFVYEEPSIKSPVIDELVWGSYVSPSPVDEKFFKVGNGYVFAKHVSPASEIRAEDYVFSAGRLLDVPYLWGGRTSRGLDCSGLVQLVLDLAGIDCPRDTDLQREAFGQTLSEHWRDVGWKRGDLVFFPGHVGIMTDADKMIHATGFAMKVIVEPLVDVVARGDEIKASGRPKDH